MAETDVNGLCQSFAFLLLVQMIGVSFQCHLVNLCKTYQASCPPKRVASFHMPRNEKDSNGNLQLTCKWKCMCVVIVITIVKCQCQKSTPIPPLYSLGEFFQRRFEIEYAIVTTQIKQMAAQISPGYLMIIEDNQSRP